MRGIIVSNPIRVHGSGRKLRLSAGLDRQELRTWLLFWDRLAVAEAASGIEFGLGPEGDFLHEAGHLLRMHVDVLKRGETAELNDLHLRARRLAFEGLEQQQPGQWAVAYGEKSFWPPEADLFAGGRALQVRLTRALPVPNVDVPLDDILNFRRKRASELTALRHYIDQLYLQVSNSNDQPLAELSATEGLIAAAQDQLRALKAEGFRTRLVDLAANFNIAGFAKELASAAAGAAFPGIVGNGLLAGATISIRQMTGLLLGGTPQTPLSYVTHYHEEVFPPEN